MTAVALYALGTAGLACVFDLKSARIPNALTFSAAAAAVIFHSLSPQGYGVSTAALGLVVGLAIFFPIFALRAMGAGDVKLMAALGAWLGAGAVVWIAIYASIAGGVFALMLMAVRGYTRQGLSNLRTLLLLWYANGIRPVPAISLDSATALRLPYALPIAVGLMVTLWRH